MMNEPILTESEKIEIILRNYDEMDNEIMALNTIFYLHASKNSMKVNFLLAQAYDSLNKPFMTAGDTRRGLAQKSAICYELAFLDAERVKLPLSDIDSSNFFCQVDIALSLGRVLVENPSIRDLEKAEVFLNFAFNNIVYYTHDLYFLANLYYKQSKYLKSIDVISQLEKRLIEYKIEDWRPKWELEKLLAKNYRKLVSESKKYNNSKEALMYSDKLIHCKYHSANDEVVYDKLQKTVNA